MVILPVVVCGAVVVWTEVVAAKTTMLVEYRQPPVERILLCYPFEDRKPLTGADTLIFPFRTVRCTITHQFGVDTRLIITSELSLTAGCNQYTWSL